jgi:transposase-like protein
MQIIIELKCPQCHCGNIVRNGKKTTVPRIILCKDCGRQFIADHEKTYRGCLSGRAELVKSCWYEELHTGHRRYPQNKHHCGKAGKTAEVAGNYLGYDSE